MCRSPCRCARKHMNAPRQTELTSPSSGSPVPAVERRPIPTFPWQHERSVTVPITSVLTVLRLGRDPLRIWKHLPDVNSEWGPKSKRYKRPRLRQHAQRKWYSLFNCFQTRVSKTFLPPLLPASLSFWRVWKKLWTQGDPETLRTCAFHYSSGCHFCFSK